MVSDSKAEVLEAVNAKIYGDITDVQHANEFPLRLSAAGILRAHPPTASQAGYSVRACKLVFFDLIINSSPPAFPLTLT